MKTLAKRSLSIFIAILMLFSVMAVGVTASAATTIPGGKTLYMRPNSQWSSDNARFAAYFFNDSANTWVNMTDSDGDGYYEVSAPNGGYTGVIFCRMDGSNAENNWDNKWNQTDNLEYDGTNDCFELTGGSWEGEGTWSVYAEKLVYFVNTKNWDEVAAYCVNTSSAGDTWPGRACKLVDADLGVYSVYPGNYPLIRFTDNTSDGDYSSQYNYADVKGKYIEPITGGVYTSAAEALTYANSESAYFVNTLGWSDVYGYGSTDGIGSNTAYPGKAATLINDEKGVYSFNPGDRKQVLFNDGTEYGSNTQFYTFADVKGKYIEPKTGGVYNSAEEAWAAASNDVVYFVNTIGWDKVSGFGWTDGIGSNTAYPGTAATLINSKFSVYSYAPGDRKQVLFNDGTENGSNTKYYTFADVKGKYIEPKTGGVYNSVAEAWAAANAYVEPDSTAPITQPTKPTETEPTNLQVSLAGSFNGWSQTENVFTHYGASDYETTVTLSAGTYNFKIVHEGLWHGNATTINDTTDSLKLSAAGGNCELKATGGEYHFYYNTSTNVLSILFTAIEVEPEEKVPTVLLSGSFNGWTSETMSGSSDNTVLKTVELESGTYYFNIVEDGLWYSSNTAIKDTIKDEALVVNGGVCTITATGGEYTFTYNYSTNALTITSKITVDPADLTSVSLAGNFNSWNHASTPLKKVSSNVVSTSLELKTGSYNFKVVQDGLWYGNSGTIVDTTTTTSDNGWELSIKEGNCTLQASGGTYTFTYEVDTKRLTITYVPSADAPAKNAEVYLAGQFNGWDKASSPMKMVSDNEVAITLSIEAGTYAFKVVNGSLWYGNTGATINNTTDGLTLSNSGSDCSLVASGGDYTFTYNVVNNKLTITYVPSDNDPAETAKVSLAGNLNGWSQTANVLTYSSENTVSTSVELAKGNYSFKIVQDGLWYGNNGTIVDTTETTSSVGWVMSIYENECTLQASGGTYTFNYNVVTKALTVVCDASNEDPAQTANVSLAGSFNGWSKTENVFTYSEENVVTTSLFLNPGTYKFKIVDDGLWYGNSGTIVNTTGISAALAWTMDIKAGDCTLDLSGGTYTFNYNVVTKKLQVLCKLDDYDPAMYSDVRLVGDFNNWDKEASKMTYVGDKAVLIDVELEAGTYQFKIIEDGVWYGNNGTIVDKTTDTSDIGWTLTESEGNCTLKTTGGKYTFIYRVVPNTIIIFHNYDRNYLD